MRFYVDIPDNSKFWVNKTATVSPPFFTVGSSLLFGVFSGGKDPLACIILEFQWFLLF